jgi:hypothetical protein
MTDLLGTRQVVEMINSSGWRSRTGTLMTAERLRVVRAEGSLGGFPEPDAYGETSGWPLWERASVQQWIDDRAALRRLLSTSQVRDAVFRQLREELGDGISVSPCRIRQELQEHYDPVTDGGTYWWPAEAPGRVLRSITEKEDLPLNLP